MMNDIGRKTRCYQCKEKQWVAEAIWKQCLMFWGLPLCICPINFDRYCAAIPEQYPRLSLPYQDPPGLGMRKTRELHGFEACPVSYRCHPGPPHPSVTPIRITPWIRPQTIIVRQHSHRHLHSGPLAICFCWFVTLNISSIPLTTPYCTLEARVC